MGYFILITLAIILGAVGFGLGVRYEHNQIMDHVAGTINIDRSIKGEENLFFEVGDSIREISKKELVVVRVTNRNYVEEEIES